MRLTAPPATKPFETFLAFMIQRCFTRSLNIEPTFRAALSTRCLLQTFSARYLTCGSILDVHLHFEKEAYPCRFYYY
ncbi:hypothetical protein Plhal304r1_c023g0080071 [Plasmopara halstedii]